MSQQQCVVVAIVGVVVAIVGVGVGVVWLERSAINGVVLDNGMSPIGLK